MNVALKTCELFMDVLNRMHTHPHTHVEIHSFNNSMDTSQHLGFEQIVRREVSRSKDFRIARLNFYLSIIINTFLKCLRANGWHCMDALDTKLDTRKMNEEKYINMSKSIVG